MNDSLVDVSNFPKAAELINAVLSQKYRVIIYGGAIRGGKTFNNAAALILLHKLFPRSRSVIIREDLERLKKNTFPTIDKLMPKRFVKRFDGTAYQWQFTNDSNMLFMGENIDKDPHHDRFNGLEFNFALLDQAEEIQQSTFDKVLERVGSYVLPAGFKQPEPLVLITINPTDTWARKLIYEKYLSGTLPANWLYIPAKITDNPFIPESYKHSLLELKRINPIKYDRYVNGDWDAKEKTGMEFYNAFNYSVHVKKVPFIESLPIHLSFDFNVVPYMTMLCCQVLNADGKTKLRFFKEYCLKNPDNTSRACAQYFIRDFEKYKPLVFYYGDRSGKNRIAGQGNKRNFDDVEAVLIKYLHTQSDRVLSKNPNPFKARDFINLIYGGYWQDIEIEVDESCTELIKDLENVKLGIEGKVKERVNDKATGTSYEKYGHTSDAMTYFIVSVLWDLYRATSAIG